MLVNRFHKIECHCGWIQRPGITLCSSVTCRASLSHYRTEQRGPKMHLIMLTAQAHKHFHALPVGIPKWMPLYIPAVAHTKQQSSVHLDIV